MVSICGPPVNGTWLFHVIIWTVSVVGVLLLRAQRPGIHCQTVFVTQHWVSTCLGISWRHTFLRNIDKMYSMHWRSFENALYKFPLYLLTFVPGQIHLIKNKMMNILYVELHWMNEYVALHCAEYWVYAVCHQSLLMWTDGAQLEFCALAFSTSEYLVSISAVPEYKLIIWYVSQLIHCS